MSKVVAVNGSARLRKGSTHLVLRLFLQGMRRGCESSRFGVDCVQE
jgi:hypothetical protein